MNKLKERGFVFENPQKVSLNGQNVICEEIKDKINKVLSDNNLCVSNNDWFGGLTVMNTENGDLFEFKTTVLPTSNSTQVDRICNMNVSVFTNKNYTAEDCLKPYDFTMFSKKFRNFAILFFGYTQINERKVKAKDFKKFLIEEFDKRFKDSEYNSCESYDFYNTLWFELCEKFKRFCV
jgi:hypothetical protein